MRTRKEGTRVPVQTGALPWRLRSDGELEILLVTGRRSGQWLIPKGWPMAGRTLASAAAQEAFEEAGVQGAIDPLPLGSFTFQKQHVVLGKVQVKIIVHCLAVTRELPQWPEFGQRERRWFSASQAGRHVRSEELAALIHQLHERLSRS
jgi:8-oxo-dGTP pyrophosphatase MutT (NUDIX family)